MCIRDRRHTEDTFDANAVLQALTYLKIVAPAADSTFFIDRELFFEKNSGTEDEFYQGLMFLYHLKHPLHSWINEHITKAGMREDTMVYYSIHNYCSPSHVIRIGVFTDRALMPVTYDLFPVSYSHLWIDPVQLYVLFGVATPSSRAVAVVISLKVDPGSYTSDISEFLHILFQ